MTLAELQYLVTLAQEKHFGRAAAICCVSQPALSNAIKNVEAELEVTVFERSRSGVQATAVGEQIIAQARRVLTSAAAIRELAHAGDNHLNTPVSVGIHTSIGPYLAPRCAIQLEKENSPLRMRAQEGDSACLVDRLAQGELDAAVITREIRVTDVLVQTLFNEPLVAVMPRQHRLGLLPALTPDCIRREIVRPPPFDLDLHHRILEVLPIIKDGPDTTFRQRTNVENCSLEMVRVMLCADSGITIMPLAAALTICSGIDDLVFRAFTDQLINRPVALAWLTGFPRHRAIDALRKVILSCKPRVETCTTEGRPNRHGLLVDNAFW